MTPTPELEPHRYPEILYSGLAALGGIAKHANEYLKTGKVAPKRLVASAFISGFSGLMFYNVAVSIGMDSNSIAVVSGIGGWMGNDGIKFIWEFICNHIK